MTNTSNYSENWEIVIGLEVHVQLSSKTKMFTASEWNYGDSPNTKICPITLGYPGTLPTINDSAVRKGILIGLSLNCDINTLTKFARKHYFYPDLPKGYQITQSDSPLCENGYINLDSNKKVRIERAHLEEDAGKTIHTLEGTALIDYNRCGAPLLEIVSAPDMSSSEEALNYLKSLKEIIISTKGSDCDMEKGNLRVDLNISVNKRGDHELGTRREVKNVNSFRNIEKAINYEFEAQCTLLESGHLIKQETLLWDDNNGVTKSIRSKEDAHDYRYFPEPDLPPLEISNDLVEEIRAMVPELPSEIRMRLSKDYSISVEQIDFLVGNRELMDYYERVSSDNPENAKKYYNWISIEIVKYLKDKKSQLSEFPISPKEFKKLIDLEINNKISHSQAKDIYKKMLETGKLPDMDFSVTEDLREIEEFIELVLNKHKDEYDRLLAGETKLINFFMGQIMRESKGKYNPSSITDYLNKKFNN